MRLLVGNQQHISDAETYFDINFITPLSLAALMARGRTHNFAVGMLIKHLTDKISVL
jgi:hypothetical protein